MIDVRTERLAKLLSVANQLNACEADVKQLWLHAENDAARLQLLLDRLSHTAQWADFCHNEYAKEILI